MRAIALYISTFLCIILLLSAGCSDSTEDSALSDTTVDDPSLLKPEITLRYAKTLSGETHTVEVIIYDKNGNSVSLKNGGVSVNSIAMTLAYLNSNNAPYYTMATAGQVTVEQNKVFTFIFTLGNGSQYTVSHTTQSHDLSSLTVPATQSKSNDLIVSWSPFVLESNESLSFVCDADSLVSTHYPTDTESTTGRKTFSKQYFNNANDTRLIVTATRSRTVEITDYFAKDSKLFSSFANAQEITLTQ